MSCTEPTEDEKKLGELAARKADLMEELAATRSELKEVARRVELPVTIVAGGRSVTVRPPPYGSGMPQCQVVRCVL